MWGEERVETIGNRVRTKRKEECCWWRDGLSRKTNRFQRDKYVPDWQTDMKKVVSQ